MKRLIFALLIGALAPRLANSGADLVLRIENPDRTLLMNRLAVQQIFTRKTTRWSDGNEIVVFVKPLGSIEHRDFTTNVLGLTSYEFIKKLENQTYSGRATSVMELPTDEMMSLKVSQTSGSVGYINYAIISNNSNIVIIDGTSIQ
jgi:ABC-type phosphate transport system substrate-binding protein